MCCPPKELAVMKYLPLTVYGRDFGDGCQATTMTMMMMTTMMTMTMTMGEQHAG
tara:strand:- start:118 stop:279 length:162 start_codon:yes stop_codon:yes gene_type:complete